MSTGYTSSATQVSSLAELYEKTNTDVKIGIKLTTEEAKWFAQYPREKIKVSGNENRVPVLLRFPTGVAMIPDGGNEAVMSTPAPTSGTFMPVQMNKRYGFTGLAQALDNRSKAAMIEEQVGFQASMAIYAFSRAIGLQTYGQSTGTVAVVKTTNSAGATQVVELKNAFGNATFCAGATTAEKTYLSNLFREDEHVALVRAGVIVEFGKVTASPSATSGVGFVDITFTSSITPTAGDNIVFANADGDSTLSGTDTNNWPIGFTEALTASSVLGISSATYSKWQAGSQQTSSEHLTFAVKEKMANEIYNASGVLPDRHIVDQAVRRDAITQERGNRRYDSGDVDLEGDLKPGDGEKVFTSQLALPGTLISWYSQAFTKVDLSDLPEEGGGKSIFKLDKVQGKSQVAAVYDYFYAKIPSSRAAMGYHSNLTGI